MVHGAIANETVLLRTYHLRMTTLVTQAYLYFLAALILIMYLFLN